MFLFVSDVERVVKEEEERMSGVSWGNRQGSHGEAVVRTPSLFNFSSPSSALLIPFGTLRQPGQQAGVSAFAKHRIRF
jgi:hypothetical protein